jgi:hypothetical protein
MPSDWSAELLRFSAFSDRQIAVTEKDWHMLTGQEEAENRSAVPGGRVFSGKFLGGLLSFGYAGQRLDIILTQEAADGQEPPFLPAIGPWKSLSDQFASAVIQWLTQTSIPMIRLAFAAVLLEPTATREAAYERLDDLLVSVNVSTSMREMIFRVNWRATSAVVDGLALNCITQWSAIRAIRKVLQVTGQDAAISDDPEGKEVNGVRLELDHNTDADHKVPFEKEKIIPIFRELLSLAEENAIKGERP